MRYNSRSFWHQIHASYLHKRTSSRRFGGWIHRIRNRRITIGWRHGWKIGWHDFPITPSDFGSIYRWSIESEELRSWVSTDVPFRTESLLEELHEGICGSHTIGRSLAHRTITQGYWWPNMQRETLEYVKKCDQCQQFAPNIHQPGGILNLLSGLWPFAQWGLDIVGPFPKAVGKQTLVFIIKLCV